MSRVVKCQPGDLIFAALFGRPTSAARDPGDRQARGCLAQSSCGQSTAEATTQYQLLPRPAGRTGSEIGRRMSTLAENSTSIKQLRLLRPASPSGLSLSATAEPQTGLLLRSNSALFGVKNEKAGPVLSSLVGQYGKIMWSKEQFKKSRTHKIKIKDKNEHSLSKDLSKSHDKAKKAENSIVEHEYFIKRRPTSRPGSAVPAMSSKALVSSHHSLFRKRPSSGYLMARYKAVNK